MKLVKINPSMSIKNAFYGPTACLILVQLTHPPLTKWLPFRRQYIQMHFREWKVFLFWLNFTEVCSYILRVQVAILENNETFVQIMAWCRIGDKPLSELVLTRFSDAYMRHYGEMSWRWLLCTHATIGTQEVVIDAQQAVLSRFPAPFVIRRTVGAWPYP